MSKHFVGAVIVARKCSLTCRAIANPNVTVLRVCTSSLYHASMDSYSSLTARTNAEILQSDVRCSALFLADFINHGPLSFANARDTYSCDIAMSSSDHGVCR